MDELNFSVVVNDEKFYIEWAGNYVSKHEHCPMTKISCPTFESLKAKGLDFHYELHLGNLGNFARLCCHLHPYNDYKNIKTKQLLRQRLEDNGLSHLFTKRDELKTAFNNEFSDSIYQTIATKFNYLGLLRMNINNYTTYNDALEKTSKFIEDTYATAKKIINRILA